MRHKKMITAIAVIYLILGAFSYALADYTLTLEPTDGASSISETHRGDEIYINIMLNDPTDVAGCAFTLEFDPAVFTPPQTDEDGLPVDGAEIVSAFPFTFETTEIDLTQTHRENSSEAGKIYFSGAAINTDDGGGLYGSAGDMALFTIKMKVNKDAAIAGTTLTLKQTELWNIDAGYGIDVGADGVYNSDVDTMGTVSVLVGAVDENHADFNDLTKAFPVLLDNPAGDLATLDLPVGACVDADIDGLCDYVETGTGVYVDADDTGTSPTDDDSDDDGLLDGVETNTDTYVDPTDTGTDPNAADSDGDGFDDKEEIDLSTDPNDATEYPIYVYFQGPDAINVDGTDDFVLMADVPDGETLKEYQITVQYDDTLITYDSNQSVGYPFPPTTVNTDTDGQIVISGLDATGVTGPDTISLVELTFTGVVAGTMDLMITIDKFGENDGNQFTMIPEDHPLEILTCQPGDANMDGSVTMADALMVAQYAVKIIGEGQVPGFLCCDVNCDGNVTMADALKIAQFAVKLIPNLDCN